MDPKKDYYSILGLQKTANEADIKNAYREIAKIVHPDIVGGSGKAFLELQEAFEVLSNPTTRAEYDVTYVPTMISVYNVTDIRIKRFHIDWCSCESCISYWTVHRQEYLQVRPYRELPGFTDELGLQGLKASVERVRKMTGRISFPAGER